MDTQNIVATSDSMIEMLTERKRLAHELDFSVKYMALNKSKTFWLGGKTTKEINQSLNEYIRP